MISLQNVHIIYVVSSLISVQDGGFEILGDGKKNWDGVLKDLLAFYCSNFDLLHTKYTIGNITKGNDMIELYIENNNEDYLIKCFEIGFVRYYNGYTYFLKVKSLTD